MLQLLLYYERRTCESLSQSFQAHSLPIVKLCPLRLLGAVLHEFELALFAISKSLSAIQILFENSQGADYAILLKFRDCDAC